MAQLKKKAIAAFREEMIMTLDVAAVSTETYFPKCKSSIFIVRFAASEVNQVNLNSNPVMFPQSGELGEVQFGFSEPTSTVKLAHVSLEFIRLIKFNSK
jgi:hypothetical protein